MKQYQRKLIYFSTLISLLFMSSCIGGDSEDHYETHDAFMRKKKEFGCYLPKNSTDIRHYAVLDFDTNYHFIEAEAKIENLHSFIESLSLDSKFKCVDVPYSDRRFDSLFYKRPIWWDEQSFADYEQSALHLLSEDMNYGKGYWFFYNE